MSGKRRRNRSSDTPPPHLRALPHWDEIEHRLRCRWTPHQVVVWHGEQHPRSRQPTVRALVEFLRHKPIRWFVVELAIASFAPTRVPWIFVLPEEAALIDIQKFRLSKLLAMEHDSGGPMPEVLQNMKFLLELYKSHGTTQRAAGVEPAERSKPERSEDGFRHPTYPFLLPDDARRLVQLQQQADSGKIELAEFYRLVAPIFEAEQRLHGERGPR